MTKQLFSFAVCDDIHGHSFDIFFHIVVEWARKDIVFFILNDGVKERKLTEKVDLIVRAAMLARPVGDFLPKMAIPSGFDSELV